MSKSNPCYICESSPCVCEEEKLSLDHFQPEESNFKDTWENPEDKVKYEAMMVKLNKQTKGAKVREQGEKRSD